MDLTKARRIASEVLSDTEQHSLAAGFLARTVLELADEVERERAWEAGAGPWSVVPDTHHDGAFAVDDVAGHRVVREDDGGLDRALCDFIAAARSDVPTLADLVLRLAHELEELRMWANSMPDAGITVDDPRLEWWLHRPCAPATEVDR